MDNKIDAGPTKQVVGAKHTDATEEPYEVMTPHVGGSPAPREPGDPKPLSKKERERRKKRRKAVKESKRRNRR